MKPAIIYILQVIICSGILYGYYHFFLRNNRFHQYNRYYLLISTIISIFIPFLDIPVYFSASGEQAIWINAISPESYRIFAMQNDNAGYNFLTATNVILILYSLVAAFILMRFLISLFHIRKIITNNSIEKMENIHFVNTDEKEAPFSFFNWIFWNKQISLQSEKGQQIFRHEIYHIKQKHSADIIMLELLSVLFWINPFFHLIKKEITVIHEFLADKFAIREQNKWEYAELLLMHLMGTGSLHLVNPFFHNQIKRRIAMITSSKQPRYQYLKKLLVLPVMILVAGLFAFTFQTKKQTSLTETSQKNLSVKSVLADTPKLNGTVKPPIAISNDSGIKKLDTSLSKQNNLDHFLYVIDGKIQSKENGKKDFQNLSINDIKSVNILKDRKAIAKYADKGKDGVVEITTKANKTVKVDEISKSKIDPLKEVIVMGHAKLDLDDKIFTLVEQSPSFPGGDDGWKKYLRSTLNAIIPVDKGAPAGEYKVEILFIVNKDGSISDLETLTKHGYGMEEEVIRVLASGPKWIPAKQNDHIVKAYRKQPVTFVIADGSKK